MPTLSDRALLLELSLFSVDNNIRRGILTVAANIPATDSAMLESSRVLSPGESWTFSSLSVNKGTVIRTQGGPINLEVANATETWTMTINSLFVVTSPLGDLTFTNPALATSNVLVRVIQA